MIIPATEIKKNPGSLSLLVSPGTILVFFVDAAAGYNGITDRGLLHRLPQVFSGYARIVHFAGAIHLIAAPYTGYLG